VLAEPARPVGACAERPGRGRRGRGGTHLRERGPQIASGFPGRIPLGRSVAGGGGRGVARGRQNFPGRHQPGPVGLWPRRLTPDPVGSRPGRRGHRVRRSGPGLALGGSHRGRARRCRAGRRRPRRARRRRDRLGRSRVEYPTAGLRPLDSMPPPPLSANSGPPGGSPSDSERGQSAVRAAHADRDPRSVGAGRRGVGKGRPLPAWLLSVGEHMADLTPGGPPGGGRWPARWKACAAGPPHRSSTSGRPRLENFRMPRTSTGPHTAAPT